MKRFLVAILDQARRLLVSPDKPASGLVNFEQVAPRLYRGSQPTPLGWTTLKTLGVTHDVKLNRDTEGSDADGVFFTRVRVISRPLPPSNVKEMTESPDIDYLASIVREIDNTLKNNGGTVVYVHCSHGHDRTGLVIACYRVWVQGWTKDAAQKEMIERGFHPELIGLWTSWQRVKEGKFA